MANSYKVELIRDGVRELLHEVGETACLQEAERIQKECGDGYEVDTKRMTTRTIASVYTDTPEAMAHEAAHGVLERAIRG